MLRSPGFPVELVGVGELHAAFLTESSTRGNVRCSVAGNPGPVGMTILWCYRLVTLGRPYQDYELFFSSRARSRSAR